MDPEAVWTLLKSQIEDAQWHEASETAENLLEWISKGGFRPKVTGSDAVDCVIVESTCRAVAAWELV